MAKFPFVSSNPIVSFFLHLLVFGCVTFYPQSHSQCMQVGDLLSHIVLVDYSYTQKGYHVYLLDQHKYIISADVTLFESTKYFSPSPFAPHPTPPSLLRLLWWPHLLHLAFLILHLLLCYKKSLSQTSYSTTAAITSPFLVFVDIYIHFNLCASAQQFLNLMPKFNGL